MNLKALVMKIFRAKPPVVRAESLRQEVRDVVHQNRNIASVAVHESRKGERVAERSLRVTEEAMKHLENARDREWNDKGE